MLVLGVLCGVVVAAPAAAAPQAASTLLDRHDFSRRTARFDLPGRLDEISGLAFTRDGRLFGHDDERATVHEIDIETGEVGKRFSLGDPPRRGDFEGMAIAGERFFLITSRGILYEFREVGDRERATYRVTDVGLGAVCEIEGLAYDESDDALLVACKVSERPRGAIVIHRLPLDGTRGPLPSIIVDRAQLRAHEVEPDFEPSGVAVDPSGTLVLTSGSSEALIEVDRTGRVLAGIQLSHDRHSQPEGVAFGPDGALYIADEENGDDARVTVYARVDTGDIR